VDLIQPPARVAVAQRGLEGHRGARGNERLFTMSVRTAGMTARQFDAALNQYSEYRSMRPPRRRADAAAIPTPPTVGTKRTATGVPMPTLADRMLEAKQNKMDRRSRGESIGNCQR